MNTLLKTTLTLLAIASTSFAEERHDHDKPIPDPKGGRILEVEGGHAEFFVQPDKKVSITFYDSEMKPAAPGEQVVSKSSQKRRPAKPRLISRKQEMLLFPPAHFRRATVIASWCKLNPRQTPRHRTSELITTPRSAASASILNTPAPVQTTRAQTQTLEDWMTERRNTRRKQTVINAVKQVQSPFTAEQLFHMAKRLVPGVSRSTVYRTICILRDEGCIKEVCLPHGKRIFAHTDADVLCVMECEDCGQFTTFPAAELSGQLAIVARERHLSPVHTSVYVRVRCQDWCTAGRCPRKERSP